MYCTHCGTRNEDRAGRCFSCGNMLPVFEGAASAPAGSVPNTLAPAIIAAICSAFCCCFLPFGVAAIVFAMQSNRRMGAGDFAGARAAARQAKIWTWVAFAGCLLVFLVVLLGVILRLAGGG